MRELILLLLLVGVASYGAALNPQGHDVSFYFWSFSVNGRLEDGRCCDSPYRSCLDQCDVTFFLCIREHKETSNICSNETSSHVTFFRYRYTNVNKKTFFEGEDVFGNGLHNPLVYSFNGKWNQQIQTVLAARDYDKYSENDYIDYILYDWTVPAGRDTEPRTLTGEFGNLRANVGLKVDCWEGWGGEYCNQAKVPRSQIITTVVATGGIVTTIITVVIVVIILACCIVRHKANRVVSQPAAAEPFSNPTYVKALPTETGGAAFQKEKAPPQEVDPYGRLEEADEDLNAYKHGYKGFVSAD